MHQDEQQAIRAHTARSGASRHGDIHLRLCGHHRQPARDRLLVLLLETLGPHHLHHPHIHKEDEPETRRHKQRENGVTQKQKVADRGAKHIVLADDRAQVP